MSFTLIELLVVTAVIAVLASLLLPVIAQAKQRARAAICLNNLKQWGLATYLYAADHDDFLPPDGTPNPPPSPANTGWYVALPGELGLPRYYDMAWRTNALAPFGGSIWICPANSRRSNGKNLFHYCLNENVNGTGAGDAPTRLCSIRQPALLVWLFDSKNLPAVGSWSYAHTNLL
ncbi:MAG: type II secretion system GspH family protein, partial [Candidatus Omnitrophica bacterium]|nr:type II secretion system GspH family protein [Candidatus Omnitrophota bacterium]